MSAEPVGMNSSGPGKAPNAQAKPSIKETLEKNKLDALRLAKEIYTVVKDPEFLKVAPETRMQIVKQKCPEFCKAYPMVVSWMVFHGKYSNKAFEKYLDQIIRDHGKQNKDVKPGEGYKEWAKKQANYAKILYQSTTPHYSTKVANRIWNTEYKRIIKAYDDMKKEEEKYKSEFAEEKEQHADEKIDEILDLVDFARDDTESKNMDDVHARAKNIKKVINARVNDDEEEEEELDSEEIEHRRVVAEKLEIRRQAEVKLMEQERVKAEAFAVERQKHVNASFLPQPNKKHKKRRRKRKHKRKK